MKIRPLHDWTVVKRIDAGEKTAGGIIIPGAAREKPAEGIIEAIGPGKYGAEVKGKKERFIPTTLKAGQRVIFTDFMAKDVSIDGEEITLVREEDILGTYEGHQEVASRKSHPVTVKEGMPLLVPEKKAERSAREKTSKPSVRRRAKSAKTSAKKKTLKSGKQTGKSVKKTAEKAGKKTASPRKRPKESSVKAATRKAATKKVTAKKPSARKATAVRGRKK